MQNKTFLQPEPDKCSTFSFSKMQTLSSFYQVLQCLYQLPQCSDPQQTNRDLISQTHDKASKDTIPTIPTDYSIKTHHTHKPKKISFLRPTAKPTFHPKTHYFYHQNR